MGTDLTVPLGHTDTAPITILLAHTGAVWAVHILY